MVSAHHGDAGCAECGLCGRRALGRSGTKVREPLLPDCGAGIWLLLLPWLRSPVLQATEPIGLRFAVLAAAFLLFAPPLTLLGMVSPYAIRLRASCLGNVGRTAGDLYALSTIGQGPIAALVYEDDPGVVEGRW